MASLRAAEAEAATEVSSEKLPEAKEILENYTRAIGGKEAFRKHQSQRATGLVEMKAQGLSGKMEVFAQRPNKMLMKLNMPGIGDTTTGFDGQVGWMMTALTGPMLLEGNVRDQIATQADFDFALRDPADFESMKVEGIETFNGEKCYKVSLKHKTGFEATEFYSLKTGLQQGSISVQDSPLGPIKGTSTVVEYKKFHDLLLPAKVVQKSMGIETSMTFTEVHFDDVDPAVFEMPKEVRALLAEPAAPDAPDAAKESPDPKEKQP